jgi:uncharacterized protein
MAIQKDAAVINPQWGLIGTVVWGLFIAVLFVVVQAIVVLTQKMALGDGNALALASLATCAVCSVAIFIVIALKKNSKMADYLALRAINKAQLQYWLGLCVVLILLIELAGFALGRPFVHEFMKTAYRSADPKWLFGLAIIVAAPIFEELFFRGFLLSGLAASRVGPMSAVVLTALLWAVIHQQYDVYDMSIVFAIGLLLGMARLKTQSLWMPMLMHSLLNGIATVGAAVYLAQP